LVVARSTVYSYGLSYSYHIQKYSDKGKKGYLRTNQLSTNQKMGTTVHITKLTKEDE